MRGTRCPLRAGSDRIGIATQYVAKGQQQPIGVMNPLSGVN